MEVDDMKYPKFEGIKWRDCGMKSIPNPDPWMGDTYIEKVDFRMTYTYIKYLKGKKLATLEDEISIFKNRLDYEYRNFGEVDDIDFQEYENTLKEYLKLKDEYEEKYNEKWR